MIILAALILAIAALTELQVDEIIRIFESVLNTIGAGVKTVWDLLSPVLLAYLAYKQAMNRKALDNNTAVSERAFKEANGINQKIADSTALVEKVVATIAPQPIEVHVNNGKDDPVPTKDV